MGTKKRRAVFIFVCASTFLYFLSRYLFLPEVEFFEPRDFEFSTGPYVDEEVEWRLAYGISVYRDGHQFLRLLRLIYRPFNLYCVHVDSKSSEYLRVMMANITERYSNVIVPARTVRVVHSQFSVLESDLLCMEALLKDTRIPWKYFINLTGQEMPLKTNLEIVRILKRLRGANLMEKTKVNEDRIPRNIGPPPHGISLWKGSLHIVAVHDFVKFALQDPRAIDLLEYLRGTYVPDETFYSTLNHEHSLQAPGGYSGNLTTASALYPFLNRHKIWKSQGECHGRFLRGICLFSMRDVPKMISNENMNLFANKFVVGINDDVSAFMGKWFENRSEVIYAYTNDNPFINLTYYSQLTVVENHY